MNEQTGLTRVARALLGWSPARLEPADRAWIEAIEAEMDTIDGTLAQLEWAAGAYGCSGQSGGET